MFNRSVSTVALLFAATLLPAVSAATFDEAAAPGRNYDKAEFRLWYPDGAASLAAAVILVPGSNGDGRSSVDDPVWQAFAIEHNLALVRCRFTDKQHEQNFIEEYANFSKRDAPKPRVFTLRSRRLDPVPPRVELRVFCAASNHASCDHGGFVAIKLRSVRA